MKSDFAVDWDRVESIEKVIVQFKILSRGVIDDVRAELGIEPSYYWKHGDIVPRNDGRNVFEKRGRSQWTLQSDLLGVKSKDADVHFKALFDILEPWKEKIRQWAANYYVRFEVWFYCKDAISGRRPNS